MPIEEDTLALLEEGRLASVQTEERRQARYKAEDIARAQQRENEDMLAAEGDKVREAKVTEMNEAIAARGQSDAAKIDRQNERIAVLEQLLVAKQADNLPSPAIDPTPVVVHQPDPVIPLVDDVHNEGTHTA